MKISFSAVELFFSYLDGTATIDEVAEHEAYRIVFSHGHHFGNKITKHDIENALKGEKTLFYGLENVYENLPRIKNLLKTIEENKSQWLNDVKAVFSSLLPEEDLSTITVYPIVGYDAGIGVENAVCMNINWNQYLNDFNEFMYFIIHEVFHVLYQRSHKIPPLKNVITPEDWLSYFILFLHNEGYAIYCPLRLREERGHLDDRDYIVLSDEKKIREHLTLFRNTLHLLQETPLTFDEYCHHIFGPHRLTYRVGCELIRRIEKNYGHKSVKKGVYMESDQFFSTYSHLIDKRR